MLLYGIFLKNLHNKVLVRMHYVSISSGHVECNGHSLKVMHHCHVCNYRLTNNISWKNFHVV